MLEHLPASCEEFQRHLTMFDVVSLAHQRARRELAVVRRQRPSVWWLVTGFALFLAGLALMFAGSGWARPMVWGDFALAIVYIVRECRWQRREVQAEAELNALTARLRSL